VKFLVDAQLPPDLAAWLREQGHEAQAVREVDLRAANDDVIWTYAERTGSAILTKDEDFAARSERTDSGPVIAWLRLGNASNKVLRAWLEPRMAGILQLISQGSRLVEVI